MGWQERGLIFPASCHSSSCFALGAAFIAEAAALEPMLEEGFKVYPSPHEFYHPLASYLLNLDFPPRILPPSPSRALQLLRSSRWESTA